MRNNFRSPFGDAPALVLRWPTERSREWVCKFLNSVSTNESILAVVAIGSAVRPNVLRPLGETGRETVTRTCPECRHPAEGERRQSLPHLNTTSTGRADAKSALEEV